MKHIKQKVNKLCKDTQKNHLSICDSRINEHIGLTALKKTHTNKRFMLTSLLILLIFIHAMYAAPFSHAGKVLSVASAGQSTFFTAGEDGFVAKWSGNKAEHYQISSVPIKIVAASANSNLIAVYETGGKNINRVSVWDWTAKKRKFARKFNDEVTSLSFSPKSGYLVVGTTSSSGAVFLMPESGSVVKKIKTSIGSVSYAALSGTEQTMFAYSARGRATGGKTSGVITYVDMKTGNIKMNKGKQLRFNTDAMLEQPVLFHNNVFLAGVKGNEVRIIAADSGNVAASFNAANPVILQDSKSKDLCYIEGNGAERTLMFVGVEGRNISEPQTVSKTRLGEESVVSGASFAGTSMFATSKGNVYLANIDNALITVLTKDTHLKILDGASQGSSFYFLTPKSVIQSSYDNPSIVHIANNDGKTNMTVWDEGIILWSRGTLQPVMLLDTAHGNMALDSTGTSAVEIVPKVLFTPKAAINTLHAENGKIIYVEGNNDVKTFDIAMMRDEYIYGAPSVKDAILAGGAVYVAKLKDTDAAPLIKVDIITREAVPVRVAGRLSFSLASDGTYIYGVKITGDSANTKSFIFSYNVETGMNSDLISYASEDTSAFIALENNNLITNLGGSSLLSYNTVAKRSVSLIRTTSFPVTALSTPSRTAVVGNDGSVSWYANGNGACLSTWYLKEDDSALSWSED